jgi:hypothetical protein
MRTILLIDDMRFMSMVHEPEDGDTSYIARSYEIGLMRLEMLHPVDVLYIDHDLASWETLEDGTKRERTGYDIMCWLEEHPELKPGKIICVSSNPSGRARIQQVIDKLYPK